VVCLQRDPLGFVFPGFPCVELLQFLSLRSAETVLIEWKFPISRDINDKKGTKPLYITYLVLGFPLGFSLSVISYLLCVAKEVRKHGPYAER
jgi:hypothetical protein